MKIATWNLERPKQPKTVSEKNASILKKLKSENADILILTETNNCIDLSPEYAGYPTEELAPSERCTYTKGENRTTIWTKFRKTREIQTRNPLTSICVGLQTECGEVFVYGTIIGVLGHATTDDLGRHISDWEEISALGSICIAGDFNTSFCDNYHGSNEGRALISNCFERLGIDNLTKDVPLNVIILPSQSHS